MVLLSMVSPIGLTTRLDCLHTREGLSLRVSAGTRRGYKWGLLTFERIKKVDAG